MDTCQFCGLDMIFKASVVDIKGYITCGKDTCISEANAAANRFYDLNPAVAVEVLIFHTETPEDDASWRLLPKEDHPQFFRAEGVMTRMINGDIVNLKGFDMFYVARLKSEVEKECLN